GVQSRLDPAEVVLGAPVARQCLNRRQLDALGLIKDRLLLGPASRCDAPAKVFQLALRNLDRKWPDLGSGTHLCGAHLPLRWLVNRCGLRPSACMPRRPSRGMTGNLALPQWPGITLLG